MIFVICKRSGDSCLPRQVGSKSWLLTCNSKYTVTDLSREPNFIMAILKSNSLVSSPTWKRGSMAGGSVVIAGPAGT